MSPTQASIFHRCDTRDKAAIEAAQKGVAITAIDTIAHIQAKILLSVHGVQDPATDDYYGTVLNLCQLDKCEVKDVYGMEKGYKYERKIVVRFPLSLIHDRNSISY